VIISALQSAFQQGCLYAPAAFGVALSFRVLNFPDMTVDGAFTLGAAVLAMLLMKGVDPNLAMTVALASGFVAGSSTVLLNRKLGISKLLSGILMMMILYSVNLRVMGQSNISLLDMSTVLSGLEGEGVNSLSYMLGLSIIPLVCFAFLCYLVSTPLGLFMRATGDNEFMVRGNGVNTDWPYLIGLGLSNLMVAGSGALVAQSQGFSDVNMGLGLIMTGLASLIIGESIIGIFLSLSARAQAFKALSGRRCMLLPWGTFREFGAAFFGCFMYFFILAICLRMGLAPTDLKLGTGLLVIVGVALRFKGPEIENYARSRW